METSLPRKRRNRGLRKHQQHGSGWTGPVLTGLLIAAAAGAEVLLHLWEYGYNGLPSSLAVALILSRLVLSNAASPSKGPVKDTRCNSDLWKRSGDKPVTDVTEAPGDVTVSGQVRDPVPESSLPTQQHESGWTGPVLMGLLIAAAAGAEVLLHLWEYGYHGLPSSLAVALVLSRLVLSNAASPSGRPLEGIRHSSDQAQPVTNQKSDRDHEDSSGSEPLVAVAAVADDTSTHGEVKQPVSEDQQDPEPPPAQEEDSGDWDENHAGPGPAEVPEHTQGVSLPPDREAVSQPAGETTAAWDAQAGLVEQDEPDNDAPVGDEHPPGRRSSPPAVSPPLTPLRSGFGVSGGVLGLHLGADCLNFVHLIPRKGKAQVRNFGHERIPAGTFDSDGVVDSDRLGEVLNKFLSRHGVPRKRAVLALAGGILRVTRFPAMTRSDLMKVLRWEADQHLPLGWDDAYIDASILTPDRRSGRMDVLLAAYPRTAVDSAVAALERAGMRPAALEVPAVAAARALGWIPCAPWAPGVSWQADSADRTVALLYLGFRSAAVMLFRDGVPVMNHTVVAGGRVLVRTISRLLAVDEDEAEEAMFRGLSDPEHGDALSESMSSLAAEVGRPVSYFLKQSRTASLVRVYVAGYLAGVPGLGAFIEEQIRTEAGDYVPGSAEDLVVVPDVAGTLPLEPHAEAARDMFDSSYLVALGLALRTEAN